MRYLLLDRIVRLERNKEIQAIKNITLSEDVYADHFFGFPVMPGALQIECLAQAGTALLEAHAAPEVSDLLTRLNFAIMKDK